MDTFWAREFKLADCHKEPLKWNTQCESLSKDFASVDLLEHLTAMKLTSATGSSGSEDEEMLSTHRNIIQDLCLQQRELTMTAARFFAMDDFEAKWLRSSASTREKHLLEGIVRTCTMAPGMEDTRLYCYEITLSLLQKAGGRGYLNLLKKFLIADTTLTPTTPILITNPQWDQMIGKNKSNLSESNKIMQAYMEGTRNIFICKPIQPFRSEVLLNNKDISIPGYFLLNALESFHGQEQAPTNVIKASSRNRVTSDLVKRGAKYLGESKPALTKHMKDEINAGKKGDVMRCESCRKTEGVLGKGFKWKWCSSCRQKLDRRIYYCSRSVTGCMLSYYLTNIMHRECQTADWARHKSICGKKMTLKDAEASAARPQPSAPKYKYPWEDPMSCNENIGPAKAGYKRTPALMHQINEINAREGLDYCIFPRNMQPRAIFIQDIHMKMFFRESRAKAMESGDREAVAIVAQYLVRSKILGGVPRSEIIQQLNKEYGPDVGEELEELEQWCASEADGLSMVETQRKNHMNTTKELFGNPEKAGLRDEMIREVASMLTGNTPFA